MNTRTRGLRKKRRLQAHHALQLSDSKRIEVAGQLYIELIALLSQQAVENDAQRRKQAQVMMFRRLQELRY